MSNKIDEAFKRLDKNLKDMGAKKGDKVYFPGIDYCYLIIDKEL